MTAQRCWCHSYHHYHHHHHHYYLDVWLIRSAQATTGTQKAQVLAAAAAAASSSSSSFRFWVHSLRAGLLHVHRRHRRSHRNQRCPRVPDPRLELGPDLRDVLVQYGGQSDRQPGLWNSPWPGRRFLSHNRAVESGRQPGRWVEEGFCDRPHIESGQGTGAVGCWIDVRRLTVVFVLFFPCCH